ncbi:hypothetical protein V6N12_052614 [Hibiscus sabdariffa]|uniref:Uncharacterized protein n=1 Tax=Hibiscus sabdariffa TaxID=183260 RepID=A0ABR2C210_9ROSI
MGIEQKEENEAPLGSSNAGYMATSASSNPTAANFVGPIIPSLNRLSIALEILMVPKTLFLDEPTSGLDDGASAFFVVQALRNIARDGRTTVSSIYQLSSALFDDLFLFLVVKPPWE